MGSRAVANQIMFSLYSKDTKQKRINLLWTLLKVVLHLVCDDIGILRKCKQEWLIYVVSSLKHLTYGSRSQKWILRPLLQRIGLIKVLTSQKANLGRIHFHGSIHHFSTAVCLHLSSVNFTWWLKIFFIIWQTWPDFHWIQILGHPVQANNKD